MSALSSLLFGGPDLHLWVGIGDDEDGGLRVYLDMRSTGLHTHLPVGATTDDARRQWGNGRYPGHQYLEVPRTALCDCPTKDPT